jgi:hypothetical protein
MTASASQVDNVAAAAVATSPIRRRPSSSRRRHAQLTSTTAEMPRTQALRAVEEKRRNYKLTLLKMM